MPQIYAVSPIIWMIMGSFSLVLGVEQNSSGSFLEVSIEVWPSVGVTTR